MNQFVCATGAAATVLRVGVPHSRASRSTPPGEASVAVLTCEDFTAVTQLECDPIRPFVATLGALAGVGDVRLDNRDEVIDWLRSSRRALRTMSDLGLVLAAFDALGPGCVDRLLGDFGFVVWDARVRTLWAVRDAFGVRALFYREEGEDIRLSNRADLIATPSEYNAAYAADFLVAGHLEPGETIWAGCRSVPVGSVLRWNSDARASVRRYWSAGAFALDSRSGSDLEQIDAFRALFEDGIRTRLDPGSATWAQLSGGLDSSSIVSLTQARVERGTWADGIAGTVTYVDTLADGDDRRYAQAVAARHGLRNEIVSDCWYWQDDGVPPPVLDEPRPHYPFWARDRQMSNAVRAAGGRVVLSGHGADHYLTGSAAYITDLFREGHLTRGLREVLRHATVYRQSFWRGLGRRGLLPFLPTGLQLAFTRPSEAVPAWLDRSFVRRWRMDDRLPAVRHRRVNGTGHFAHEIIEELSAISHSFERGPFQDGLEVRYPFLYRPLVEFSLRLPPHMRLRPPLGKWVLREAMHGVLPEAVRTRTGKGDIAARTLWSLQHERDRLREVLRDPVVAQLGWVDALIAPV